jgi:tetratricopeptide (TPR) repeat protein
MVWSGAALARRWHCERTAEYGSAAVVGVLALLSWIQIGTWRDSRTLWAHALEACGESTLTHSNLAVTYLHEFDQHGGEANLDQSADHYSEAIRLDPNNVHAMSQLAAVRSKQGRTKETVELLIGAARLKPDWDVPWFNLGVAYTELKRPQEAIEAYSKALDINPRMEAARHNLQLLRKSSGK